MKLIFIIFLSAFLNLSPNRGFSQCSVCTKTALQMGEKPAQGLNQGILYLMFTPLIIIGFIGYRWWKNEKLMD
jgi:hypothetical protein